ncbi:NAD(P)-dependent oxidoreductase [bacterium]|nr:NAD(P)-dependent oxidoreductase [bacterium]
MGSRILVIGSSGYLGSQIVQSLQTAGFTLEDNPSSQLNRSQVLIQENADCQDVSHTAIFAAGRVEHPRQHDEIARYLADYLGLLENAVRLAASLGFGRFIMLSTGDVYGKGHQEPIKESAPIRPIGSYATSRAKGEELADKLCRMNGLELLLCRLFLVVGPNQKSRFVGDARSDIMKKGYFNLQNPDFVRDFLAVEDFCEFVSGAVNQKSWQGVRAVNVSTGKGLTLFHVAELIADTLGGRVEVSQQSLTPPLRPSYLCGNPALAMKVFDWKAVLGIDETLKKALKMK